MIINRVKNLIPAPKDAEQLYLVVTPSQLLINESGNWKDNRDSFTVEVWKQKGKDDPTQNDMGEYSVYIYKNGSSTVSVIEENTPRFRVQASKGDLCFDVRLKVGDAYVHTITVDVTKDGISAVTYYTWIRYADTITFDSSGNATGGTGMSNSPVDGSGNFKEYIGFAYNKTTPTESDSYTQYKWTKFKGTDGTNGVNGEKGADGQSLYTWIKYADALESGGYPTSMYDTPKASTEYIGIAVNKTTQTESNTPSDYAWSKFKGDQGVQGPQGNPGPNGTGISNTTYYYLATTMATGVSRSTSGWTTSYQQGSADLPYVWRYSDTLLTNGTHLYSECELIFSYSAGANPNLLEQTNFSSLASMDSWISKGAIASNDGNSRTSHIQVTTGTQAHNAIRDYLTHGGNVVIFEELLRQAVTGSKRKLEPNTWYTLSFWSKGSHTKQLSIAAGGYGYQLNGTYREIWLESGHTYRITVNGYISRNGNSNVDLKTFVWGPLSASSPWDTQASVALTTSWNSTVSFDFIPALSGLHGISSYVWPDDKRTGNEYGYVSYFTIVDLNCLFVTHIYPSVIDTSVQGYVDGVRTTLGSDGYCMWPESSTWVRHSYTFKTKSNLDVTVLNYVLWRIPPCIYTDLMKDVYICMPKLEVGMQATSYISNEDSTHIGQPRRRRWALNTEYFKGAVDERYEDVVLVESAGFYRCIKTHISTLDNRPGTGTYWQQYWTSAQSGQYEMLSTDLFFAEKALINNLIATLIQTGYSGSPHIEAEGSEFKIFGKGQYPAIYLAVNDNNQAVLRFQNETTGEFLYDLGPDGIMKEFSEVADSYTQTKLKKLTNVTRVSEIVDIADSACTTYYRFNEGYKQIGSGNNVTKQYHVSGGSSPSTKNAQFFTSQNYNGTTIADGWYVKPNNGMYLEQIQNDPNGASVKVVYIYQFSGGKLVSSVPVYFLYTDYQHTSKSVGCDENGNELSTSTYTYLYSYYQSQFTL